MPTKKKYIIIAVLGILAVALGYWYGMPKESSGGGGDKKEPAFLKQGLVTYYPFNGNAKDESGNGLDGEVKGATLSKDRHNADGKAYTFNGKNGHISLPVFKYGEKFTISLWANENQPNPKTSIMVSKKESRALVSFAFISHPDGKIDVRVVSASKIMIGRSTGILDSRYHRWSHFVAVYDGGNTPSSLKIFRDDINRCSNSCFSWAILIE